MPSMDWFSRSARLSLTTMSLGCSVRDVHREAILSGGLAIGEGSVVQCGLTKPSPAVLPPDPPPPAKVLLYTIEAVYLWSCVFLHAERRGTVPNARPLVDGFEVNASPNNEKQSCGCQFLLMRGTGDPGTALPTSLRLRLQPPPQLPDRRGPQLPAKPPQLPDWNA